MGRGISEASASHAIWKAWQSARETMGDRLVHRLGGTIEWDGETCSVRDRWYLLDEATGLD